MNQKVKENEPKIEWDGEEFLFTLPMDGGKVLEGKLKPALTYVIRIREVGSEEWSVGFETPFTNCRTVDLKPDTEYELRVTAKNAAGESEPAITKVRTNPEGKTDNIIPFPRK